MQPCEEVSFPIEHQVLSCLWLETVSCSLLWDTQYSSNFSPLVGGKYAPVRTNSEWCLRSGITLVDASADCINQLILTAS